MKYVLAYELPRNKRCGACDGFGRHYKFDHDGDPWIVCGACNGSGQRGVNGGPNVVKVVTRWP